MNLFVTNMIVYMSRPPEESSGRPDNTLQQGLLRMVQKTSLKELSGTTQNGNHFNESCLTLLFFFRPAQWYSFGSAYGLAAT